MSSVAEPMGAVAPVIAAALLLAANEHARRLDLPHPAVDEIMKATGASRSRAYEVRQVLEATLPTLLRPVGRPANAKLDCSIEQYDAQLGLARDVLQFVIAHPGCVRGDRHRRYSDAFRLRVIELRDAHASLPLARFAHAACVPLETLESWLRAPDDAREPLATNTDGSADHPEDDEASARIQTVLAEWRRWNGTFGDFCVHVKEHCHVPYGATLVREILSRHGARSPAGRGGRSADERALRGAFETFFPNAQWVGDGTELAIDLCGCTFRFNLELMVDPHSGAFVGASLREHEDTEAVTEALEDAKSTTKASAIALLLDNKPSNHTSEIDAALGDTMRIRATPFRPQNKAHVEGAFGLFAQQAPELVVDGDSPRAVARAIVMLVVQAFLRASNHRPRDDRGGRSRVEIHGEVPTPAQIEEARTALAERLRRQELARQTTEARQRPEVRTYLDETFARLALLDPERSIRIAVARYPLDAIVDGVAIFEGKRAAGTIAPDTDARYLLGIVRNVAHLEEGQRVLEALLRERIAARDRMLAQLSADRATIERENAALGDRLRAFVDRACAVDPALDRTFWLLAVIDTVVAQPSEQHRSLIEQVGRRIHATFRLPPRDRIEAVRFVVSRVVDLR